MQVGHNIKGEPKERCKLGITLKGTPSKEVSWPEKAENKKLKAELPASILTCFQSEQHVVLCVDWWNKWNFNCDIPIC